MEINLELLQQLPEQEEAAEDGLCYLTCTFSFARPIFTECQVTGF